MSSRESLGDTTSPSTGRQQSLHDVSQCTLMHHCWELACSCKCWTLGHRRLLQLKVLCISTLSRVRIYQEADRVESAWISTIHYVNLLSKQNHQTGSGCPPCQYCFKSGGSEVFTWCLERNWTFVTRSHTFISNILQENSNNLISSVCSGGERRPRAPRKGWKRRTRTHWPEGELSKGVIPVEFEHIGGGISAE